MNGSTSTVFLVLFISAGAGTLGCTEVFLPDKGDEGQPCLEDGTCKPGLICDQDNVCVREGTEAGPPDGGDDGGTDAGGEALPDAGDEGSSDSGRDCDDECGNAGDTQCSGTVIETCEQGIDYCLHWVEGEDCANNGMICEDAGGTAHCADICTDECDSPGDTQCKGTVIQICVEGTDGCLDWVDGDCGNCGECDPATGGCKGNDDNCTGDCDYCTGSGTVFNCAGDQSMCSRPCSACPYCESCSGSGNSFNCQELGCYVVGQEGTDGTFICPGSELAVAYRTIDRDCGPGGSNVYCNPGTCSVSGTNVWEATQPSVDTCRYWFDCVPCCFVDCPATKQVMCRP